MTPWLLLFAICMPLLIDGWTLPRVVLIIVIELMCAALLTALWLPASIGRPALRMLAAMVFLLYAAYVADEFLLEAASSTEVRGSERGAPHEAIIGLLVIGLPCLWYAVLGRLSLRAAEEPDPAHIVFGEELSDDDD